MFAVTTAVAAAVDRAGNPLTVDRKMIPLAGFAHMTFLGAAVGGLLLVALHRFSSSARPRFVEATAALTALSCVPSVAWPDHVATKVGPVAMQLLAAAILVPLVVRRAND